MSFDSSGVVAVFSDKAVADRFVDVTKPGAHFGPLRVVEARTDPFLQPLLGGLRPFEVHADDAEKVMVRIEGQPTAETIWAADPDSARLIAKRAPKERE